MKKTVLLLCAMSFVIHFTGCSDDENEGSIRIYERNREITISELMQSEQINFRANDDWEISITKTTPGDQEADWLEVFPMDGKSGDIGLTVTILEKNMAPLDRKANLVISSKNGSTGIITVVQKSVGKGIRISKITTNESGTGKEYHLTYDEKGRLMSFGDKVMLSYEKVFSESTATKLTIKGMPEEFDERQRMGQYAADHSYIVYDGCAMSMSFLSTISDADVKSSSTADMDFRFSYNTIGQLERIIPSDPEDPSLSFKWGNGNIVAIILNGPDNSQDANTIMKFTYGIQRNTYLPLNLWGYLAMSELDYFAFADFVNVRGERSAMLPSRIEGQRTLNFTYTADKNGLVTKADVEVEGKPEENFTINITY